MNNQHVAKELVAIARELTAARSVVFYNITWDTDGEDVDLPTEVEVSLRGDYSDEEISDEGADWLSDEFGWLVDGLNWDWKEDYRGKRPRAKMRASMRKETRLTWIT